MRVKRSWETLSHASAMAEQVVTLVKYSNAMRDIHSGSGIESHLPSESLCLCLCGIPPLRISCNILLNQALSPNRRFLFECARGSRLTPLDLPACPCNACCRCPSPQRGVRSGCCPLRCGRTGGAFPE